jgi:hypothetical protein
MPTDSHLLTESRAAVGGVASVGACLLHRTALDRELGDFTNAASELLLPVML